MSIWNFPGFSDPKNHQHPDDDPDDDPDIVLHDQPEREHEADWTKPDKPSMQQLPIAVFANLGTSDNLVPVKCFATFKEAEAWMEQQEKERPGYYMIDSAYDSDSYE